MKRMNAYKMKALLIGILAAALCLFLILYRRSVQNATVTDLTMGTVLTVQIYGKDADETAGQVVDLVEKLDTEELSWRIPSSELAVMNETLKNKTEVSVSDPMYEVLQKSLKLCEDSEGALDITIHPIIDLWGIETDSPKIPQDTEIQDRISHIGYTKLGFKDSSDGLYTDSTGMSIDLGALGKGIAADRVKQLLDSRNVKGAVVSIGGTILTYGHKQGGRPWQVGIRNPRGSMSDMLGVLSLKGTHVVSTSGDYEQYFEENGIRYHHIFDPATGYPADSGLMSVTIVCEDGSCSDGLSTACFVSGLEDSMVLLELYGADAIFVTTDRQVYVTDGIQESFQLTDPSYTLCEMDERGV